MTLITFKSNKEHFDVEKTDVKNWTLRLIDTDKRFITIKEFADKKLRKLHIDIICNQTQERIRRKIRAVTYITLNNIELVGLTWDEKE